MFIKNRDDFNDFSWENARNSCIADTRRMLYHISNNSLIF